MFSDNENLLIACIYKFLCVTLDCSALDVSLHVARIYKQHANSLIVVNDHSEYSIVKQLAGLKNDRSRAGKIVKSVAARVYNKKKSSIKFGDYYYLVDRGLVLSYISKHRLVDKAKLFADIKIKLPPRGYSHTFKNSRYIETDFKNGRSIITVGGKIAFINGKNVVIAAKRRFSNRIKVLENVRHYDRQIVRHQAVLSEMNKIPQIIRTLNVKPQCASQYKIYNPAVKRITKPVAELNISKMQKSVETKVRFSINSTIESPIPTKPIPLLQKNESELSTILESVESAHYLVENKKSVISSLNKSDELKSPNSSPIKLRLTKNTHKHRTKSSKIQKPRYFSHSQFNKVINDNKKLFRDNRNLIQIIESINRGNNLNISVPSLSYEYSI